MNSPRLSFPKPLLLSLMLMLLFASGCAGPSVRVAKVKDFGVQQLQRDGLMLAAVTALGGGEYLVSDTTNERFETMLSTKADGIPFVSHSAVRKAVGESEHEAFLKKISEDGEIPLSFVDAVKVAVPDVRYLMWVDLNGDQASSDVRYSQENEYRVERDRKTGEERRVLEATRYITTSSSSRCVRAVFRIVDLSNHRTVWSADASDCLSNSQSSNSYLRHPKPVKMPVPGTFEVFETMMEPVVDALYQR